MDVVITGYGAITPLGGGVAALWDGLIAGRSGVRALDLDPGRFPSGRAAVGRAEVDAETALGRANARRLDPTQRWALLAGREAWADAGSPEVDGTRLAISLGTGVGGLNTTLEQEHRLREGGARRVSPRTVPMLMANAASSQLSIELGARGGAYTPVSACAAGAEGITHGARLIAAGEADVVLAGGAEAALSELTLAAFAQSQALATLHPGEDPTTLSRPFAADRRGFVLGEGAGIVVLESEAFAAARGARVRARLAGWGITSDAFHITAPDPEGTGQRSAIDAALSRAGLTPGDVDLVNAHATSTEVGDAAEAAALRAAGLGHATVTANKGATGHLVGAAGAVEAIATVRSLETGLIPPTLNLAPDDAACGLDVVRGASRAATIGAALSTSFAFGGQNVALVLARA